MAVNKECYLELKKELAISNVTLVAVSKTKSVEDIMELYQLGQRDFGENYVQELTEKQTVLPKDIRWHFIGHLQSNKVKYIAPFVHLIHGVDSLKLLETIQKAGEKNGRAINCLLQMHVAKEESKFGLDEGELHELLGTWKTKEGNDFVRICGIMGMASFTEDMHVVRAEFQILKRTFDKVKSMYFSSDEYFHYLSMGMSGDYKLAIEEGSNMVRIGSMLFGARGGQ